MNQVPPCRFAEANATGGDSEEIKGEELSPESERETIVLKPANQEDPAEALETDGDDDYSEEFKRFWAAWPPNRKPPFRRNKRKDQKPNAWRAWKKIGPSKILAERIVASVEEHKRFCLLWRDDEGAFIPLPSAWLNKGLYRSDFADEKAMDKASAPRKPPPTPEELERRRAEDEAARRRAAETLERVKREMAEKGIGSGGIAKKPPGAPAPRKSREEQLAELRAKGFSV